MNTAEKIACAVARPMRALSVAASPFVWLLSRSTAAITRLLGLKESDNKVTEEEIRSIIQESVDDGEVRVVEQQIVGRVFSLGDRAVDSVMTPRSEIVWIDIAMTTDQIRERVNRNPHSLYPVADGVLDKLVGVVYLKDLFQHLAEPDFNLCKTLRPVKFFMKAAKSTTPWTSCAANSWATASSATSSVSRAASSPQRHLRSLVGEIPEDLDEPDIVRREDGSCLVDGQCSFYDFLAYFNMEEVIPHTAYKTISGLILDELDHIPQTGEKLHWNRFTLEIVDMDGARIDKILVTPDTIPPMKIADLELGDKPLFLAPMEDVTDPSFRSMCKEFGADVVYTEFISSDGLIRDAAKSLKKLEITEAERPVGIQIYGHLIEPMVEAARMAEAAGPDIIDINFGCPMKKIRRPRRRFGHDARRAAHGRNDAPHRPGGRPHPRDGQDPSGLGRRKQEYRRDRPAVAGRGDRSAHDPRPHPRPDLPGRSRLDAHRSREEQSRDPYPDHRQRRRGFGPPSRRDVRPLRNTRSMIGRATYGRPWIFREVRHYLTTGEVLPQPTVVERVEIAKRHLRKSVEIKGEYVGVLEMRRHLSNYFKGLPDFKQTRLQLVTLTDIPALMATLDSIAERWGDFDTSQVVPAPLSHEL